ncbi:hypothetical protein [Psychroserpens sp. S379A]|uniref:hypothetical protein n=1 Tax=Psychroserpens sp. S379A TaxID=3415137 RepID=UPI003C7B8EC8
MKKLLTLFLIVSVFTACKNDAKTEAKMSENGKTIEQNSELRTLVGQFIYYADAAVLQTRNDIYGVIINEKMHELNDMAKAYKKDPTDYVTVQVRGKVIPKPEGEEGWPFRIDIIEIDNVKKYESKENEVIKLNGDAIE